MTNRTRAASALAGEQQTMRQAGPVSRRALVMIRSALLLGIGLLGMSGLLGLSGCSRDQRPALVLVLMDTTRHDRLGCAGYPLAATRTLDSLATNGVRFASTIAVTPVTGPSIATILSGTLPPVHGMRDNARFVMNPQLPLLAESFTAAGYETGAVVGGLPIKGEFGYARGFDYYDDRFGEDAYRIYNPAFAGKLAALRNGERRASSVTDRALRWVDGIDRGRPFLLLAHFFDPHGPYDPPPAYASRHEDDYDAEIAYMDDQLGRLLAGIRERIGDRREIRVVAVGDHGEGLYEHDEWTHGFFLYDTTIKVPLLFCGGEASGGLTVGHSVRTVDIAPTICGWFGLEAPATFGGENLTAALEGGPVPASCDTAYLETYLTQMQHDWSPLQGLRAGGWKWIRAPRAELYGLTADTDEVENLIQAQPEIAAALEARMDEMLDQAVPLARQYGASLGNIDPEVARQLEALGYVSSSDSPSLVADYSLPDPKDGNREWNREMERKRYLNTAHALRQDGQHEQALENLTRAGEIAPLTGREAALEGELLDQAGRPEEALDSFWQALRTAGSPAGRGFVRLRLAKALVALDRPAAAMAHVETLRADSLAPAEFLATVEELAGQIESRR